jgi:glycosyltransferase involved in cell wall biosynthesis
MKKMPRDYATVTCAHNEREYIARCLQSILAQTCKPAKTIVVLDRCVDGSANEIAGQVDLIIRKDKVGSWHNSMSENLEIARNSVISHW